MRTSPIVILIAMASLCAAQLPPFPFENTVSRMLQVLSNAPAPTPTGLTKDNYLDVMSGIVTFFRSYQSANGSIIDPYAHEEIQYSTPTYAFSAALLAKVRNDKDLLQTSTRAFQVCVLLSFSSSVISYSCRIWRRVSNLSSSLPSLNCFLALALRATATFIRSHSCSLTSCTRTLAWFLQRS